MSLCRLHEAMIRIRGASSLSPIVVLRVNVPEHVDAFFANTVHGRAVLARNPANLVGCFHGTMDLRQVFFLVSHAIGQPAELSNTGETHAQAQ